MSITITLFFKGGNFAIMQREKTQNSAQLIHARSGALKIFYLFSVQLCKELSLLYGCGN